MREYRSHRRKKRSSRDGGGDGVGDSRAVVKTYDSRRVGRSESARSRSARGRVEDGRERRRTTGVRRRRRGSGGATEPAAPKLRGSHVVYSSRRLDSNHRPIPLVTPAVHDPEKERRRFRLEDWYLGVHLLLIWDDQKMVSAADMEKRLKRFLKEDAPKKHRINPRVTSEIFLRGVLRTLWDIDRLLKLVNPNDELTKFTRESPLVLSILRVMAYEYMWLPASTEKSVRQSVQELMEKCALSGKSDRDWITEAALRMRQCFDKSQEDWENSRRAREERKRAATATATAADQAAGSSPASASAPPPKRSSEAAHSAKMSAASSSPLAPGAADAAGASDAASGAALAAAADAIAAVAAAVGGATSASPQSPLAVDLLSPQSPAAQENDDEDDEGQASPDPSVA